MQPQSPVVDELEPYEIVLGEDQAGVLPLPILRSPAPYYAALSRWQPSEEERKLIAEGADIYLTVWTYGAPHMPVALEVMRRTADPELIRERMDLDRELDQRMKPFYDSMKSIMPSPEASETESPGDQHVETTDEPF